MTNQHRINPVTGEEEWFFPMEITSAADREYAKLHGFETGFTRLGYRVFEAVMIPCKDVGYDEHGLEVFISTPPEKQRRRYLDLIKDEMNEQEDMKQEGRCVIPNGRGGLKRCPCRIGNPNYTPTNGQPKTIPVECDGCKYEEFKNSHTIVQLSALDQEDESGEITPYEPIAEHPYDTAWMYLKRGDEFLHFVQQHDAKLLTLAKLFVLEYTKSEASRELNLATSTVGSRTEKLKKLVIDFLETVV